jgi:hypothetical protein
MISALSSRYSRPCGSGPGEDKMNLGPGVGVRYSRTMRMTAEAFELSTISTLDRRRAK